MPTSYTPRSAVTSLETQYDADIDYSSSITYTGVIFGTQYNLTRTGGAYLKDILGRYITTINGDRIVVIVPGGNLPKTVYSVRTPI